MTKQLFYSEIFTRQFNAFVGLGLALSMGLGAMDQPQELAPVHVACQNGVIVLMLLKNIYVVWLVSMPRNVGNRFIVLPGFGNPLLQ